MFCWNREVLMRRAALKALAVCPSATILGTSGIRICFSLNHAAIGTDGDADSVSNAKADCKDNRDRDACDYEHLLRRPKIVLRSRIVRSG